MKILIPYTVGNLYKLKWDGGGEIPQALAGMYTSAHEALVAGQAYTESRRPKAGEKRAKSKS
jgi:hypothetical protein